MNRRFCPILSAIGTPTYKLTKFCDQLLKPLTKNEYTIKDYSSFANEVLGFNASLFMASFDIKSLFTNITPNRNVKPLCTKPLEKSDTCWQFD